MTLARTISARTLSITFAATALSLAALPAAAQNQAWIEQTGTSSADSTSGAAPDGTGGVYVGGGTSGNLGGTNAGSGDAWLARYDAAGNQTWIRQLGSSGYDETLAIVADSSSGVFVAGQTFGDLDGPNLGGVDAWLARYDDAGNLIWTVQFGTSWNERALAAAPDGRGGVYVCGSTSGSLAATNLLPGTDDAFLAHFDSDGNATWIVQIGSTLDDLALAAASDGSGGVYVGGRTDLNLVSASAGGSDAWLARYDSTGARIWIQQFGTTSHDMALSAARDGSGGVYLGGETSGNFGGPNAGFGDAWIARIDGTGNQLWIRQFGTSLPEGTYALAPNGTGGVFLTGTTGGSLGGTSAGSTDAWLARYDGAGNALGLLQLGTVAADDARAAATDGAGGVYLGGSTNGSLGGPNTGSSDAWLARYEPCGSGTSYCSASSTSIAGCQAAIGGTGEPSLANPGGYTLSSGLVPGGNIGICFFGDNGAASSSFGTLGGQVCVQGPFFRSQAKPSGGSAGVCDGTYAFTLQDLINASPIITSGAVIHAEIWARDPGNPDGFLLSNGLQLTVCP